MIKIFQHDPAVSLPNCLWASALLTPSCSLCTGSAFKQAGEAVAGAAKDVYSQSVQFARQEWNGTERAINTVEGALQVNMCPCTGRMTIMSLLAMQKYTFSQRCKTLASIGRDAMTEARRTKAYCSVQ